MVKILCVTFSSGSEEWCSNPDPIVVEKEYLVKKRKCKKVNNLPLINKVLTYNPDVIVFGTQNEASSSSLHDTVAAAMLNIEYREVKREKTTRLTLSTIAVQTSIFVKFDASITVDSNWLEIVDNNHSRTAAGQSFYINEVPNPKNPDTMREDYSLEKFMVMNVYLPSPSGDMHKIYSRDPYPLYRQEVISANARFLYQILEETAKFNTGRELIFMGDFDTEIKSDYPISTNYRKEADEMEELKYYFSGRLNLQEHYIDFPPTSGYDTTKLDYCVSSSSCYIPEVNVPTRRAGWRDRILYTPGLSSAHYGTISDKRVPITTDHLAVMVLLDTLPSDTRNDSGSEYEYDEDE